MTPAVAAKILSRPQFANPWHLDALEVLRLRGEVDDARAWYRASGGVVLAANPRTHRMSRAELITEIAAWRAKGYDGPGCDPYDANSNTELTAIERVARDMKAARTKFRISLRDVAVVTGVSEAALRNIENGKSRDCHGETFLAILIWASRLGYRHFAGFDIQLEGEARTSRRPKW